MLGLPMKLYRLTCPCTKKIEILPEIILEVKGKRYSRYFLLKWIRERYVA